MRRRFAFKMGHNKGHFVCVRDVEDLEDVLCVLEKFKCLERVISTIKFLELEVDAGGGHHGDLSGFF